jgi:hypothetical protein
VYNSTTVFSGNQSLYRCIGVQELCLVKNLMPSRASSVRKRVWARVVECKHMCEGLFIDYRAPWFTKLAKCKKWQRLLAFQECSSTLPSALAKQNDPGLVVSITRKDLIHFGSGLPDASMSGIHNNTWSPTSIFFCLTFLSLSHPVLRKQKRSLHTCAQDVQITCTATICSTGAMFDNTE